MKKNYLKNGWILFVVGVILSGCNSTMIRAVKTSETAIPKQSVFKVNNFKNADQSKSIEYNIEAVIPLLTQSISKELQSSGYQIGDGFIIDGEITKYDPGNQVLRYLAGGFGAGKGSIQVIVKIKDNNGKVLSVFEVSKVQRSGFFGGESKSLIKALAKKIVLQIKKHQ